MKLSRVIKTFINRVRFLELQLEKLDPENPKYKWFYQELCAVRSAIPILREVQKEANNESQTQRHRSQTSTRKSPINCGNEQDDG